MAVIIIIRRENTKLFSWMCNLSLLAGLGQVRFMSCFHHTCIQLRYSFREHRFHWVLPICPMCSPWHSKSASWGSTFPTHTPPACLRARRQRRCPPGSSEWRANCWMTWVNYSTTFESSRSAPLWSQHCLSPKCSASVIVFLNAGWPVFLAQSTQPDVCSQPSPLQSHHSLHTLTLVLMFPFETWNWNH